MPPPKGFSVQEASTAAASLVGSLISPSGSLGLLPTITTIYHENSVKPLARLTGIAGGKSFRLQYHEESQVEGGAIALQKAGSEDFVSLKTTGPGKIVDAGDVIRLHGVEFELAMSQGSEGGGAEEPNKAPKFVLEESEDEEEMPPPPPSQKQASPLPHPPQKESAAPAPTSQGGQESDEDMTQLDDGLDPDLTQVYPKTMDEDEDETMPMADGPDLSDINFGQETQRAPTPTLPKPVSEVKAAAAKAEVKAKEETERLEAEQKAKAEADRLKAEQKAKEEADRLEAEQEAMARADEEASRLDQLASDVLLGEIRDEVAPATPTHTMITTTTTTTTTSTSIPDTIERNKEFAAAQEAREALQAKSLSKSSKKRKKTDEPEAPSPKRLRAQGEINILVTGVDIDEVEKKVAKIPKAQLIKSIRSAHNCTHVIACNETLPIKRTPKLLVALNSNSTRYILGAEWLEQSADAKQALDETDFLVSNWRYKVASDAFNEKYSITASELLEYQSYKAEDARIFEGAAVYFESGVPGQQFPQADDLKLIVSAGGGKTLANLSGKTTHDRLIVVTKTAKISKLTAATYASKGHEVKTLTPDEFLAVVTEQFDVFTTSEAFDGEEKPKKKPKKAKKASPKPPPKSAATKAKAKTKAPAPAPPPKARSRPPPRDRTPVTKARTSSSKAKVVKKSQSVKVQPKKDAAKKQPAVKKTRSGSAPRRSSRTSK
mmetsp:Transcript_31265/g.61952  ORF Transcript_31265/g.61952 Transcript_31265/m.61952 type:complete len:719 (+) Transcript_31265:100-2256(+)